MLVYPCLQWLQMSIAVSFVGPVASLAVFSVLFFLFVFVPFYFFYYFIYLFFFTVASKTHSKLRFQRNVYNKTAAQNMSYKFPTNRKFKIQIQP